MGLLRSYLGIYGLIALQLTKQLIGLCGTISKVKFWSAKGEELGMGNMLQWTMMNIFCFTHVGLRLVSYALLSAQYPYYAAALLPLQFSSNFLTGQRFRHDNHQGCAIQWTCESLGTKLVAKLG